MTPYQLTCFACGKSYDPRQLIGLCTCGKPLRVDYDFKQTPRPEAGFETWSDFAAVLQVEDDYRTLGEGWTPLLGAPGFGRRVLIKDEGLNPTGSFKARGMAMAVYMAWKLGATKLAVPSAGNAGGALAAYAALYGLEAHVFMPRDVPMANRLECELYGAKVTLVDGLIGDCAKLVMEGQEREGWFDASTLKEPYRIEGKKTMGYEIVAQLGWKYPGAILYPTGGGTGLIGMWKAFAEMEKLGWVSGKRPKMYSVQAEGCAPIVREWNRRKGSGSSGVEAVAPEPPHTVAAGLRVPKALGDFIILDILSESEGGAIAVTDEALIAGAREMARETGICACPEGGACLAALRHLKKSDEIGEEDPVILFNTGSGLKYSEAFAAIP